MYNESQNLGNCPNSPTFFQKSWTKNFIRKTNVFPYKVNVFESAERPVDVRLMPTEVKHRYSSQGFLTS